MEPRKTAKTYSPEVRARAVRMVLEHQGEHASQWAAICSIAAKIGCSGETLREWVRQAERDQGLRAGPTTRDAGAASRRWSGRTASCARPTRSCARPARILRWRSSTAGPSHDRVHRRSPRRPRGRADLQGAADRPVDVPRPRRPPRRSAAGAAAGAARRRLCASRSGGSGRRTSRSTVCARSGGSSAGRGSRWRAARWRG